MNNCCLLEISARGVVPSQAKHALQVYVGPLRLSEDHLLQLLHQEERLLQREVIVVTEKEMGNFAEALV